MALRPQLLRVLTATGALAIAVSTGGCGEDGSPADGGGSPTTTTTTAASRQPERTGLPEVASAAPQPDTVAARLGDTVTVTGKSLFGDKSATVEVTLSGPRLIPEVRYPKTGAVQRPERGVFVVFEVAIEGVEGTYEFNPRHFRLIPSGDVAGWRSETAVGLAERPDAPTQIDALDSISFGSISAGDRISGTLVFDQPRSAVGDAAVVLRALLLTEGPASAYWPVT